MKTTRFCRARPLRSAGPTNQPDHRTPVPEGIISMEDDTDPIAAARLWSDLAAVQRELAGLNVARTNYRRARWVIANSLFMAGGLILALIASKIWWLILPAVGCTLLAAYMAGQVDVTPSRGQELDKDFRHATARKWALVSKQGRMT